MSLGKKLTTTVVSLLIISPCAGAGDIPDDVRGVGVSGGEFHTLVLTASGTVWACGDNYDYQLGNGQGGLYEYEATLDQVLKGDMNSPTAYLAYIEEVGAGWTHSLALDVNGKELYDIKADPGQENDIAEKHPEVVANLRAEYENWWTDTSKRFLEHCPIVIGSGEENPSRLGSHDLHGDAAWAQDQVRKAKRCDGFWAVEVARDGEYEFALRRWPEEADAPINAATGDDVAINPATARLKIGGFDQTQPVPQNAKAVIFKAKLNAGKTKLWAWFIEADGQSRSAYYVYVKRLG